MENKKSVDDIVSVDAREAKEILASGYGYVDVRLSEDFEKGHIDGAINIPFYSSVTPQGKVKNLEFIEQVSSIFQKDAKFIVGCNSGVRSKLATVDLLNAGFENIKNMKGGYLSWTSLENEGTC